MQLLKNIVNNGLIVLGLSSGLMVSALAAIAVEPPSFEEWLSAEDDSYKYSAAEAAIADAEADIADAMLAAQLDFSELDADTLKMYADVGNANAQFYLGMLYSNGKGVRQDYSKAAELYLKAANTNYADFSSAKALAQFNLGILHINGYSVNQSKVTAKEWFGKSCDNGYQDGCDEYKKLNQKQAVVKSK